MTLPTAGERLAGRQLAKELRAGVEHYKPGQMRARQCPEDRDVYEVTWVNGMGHACCVLVIRELNGWVPYPIYAEAGQSMHNQKRLPENFALTDGMKEHLDAALAVASRDTERPSV